MTQRTLFPVRVEGMALAFDAQPVMLDGMQVLFDKTVGLYPVQVEPKAKVQVKPMPPATTGKTSSAAYAASYRATQPLRRRSPRRNGNGRHG